MQGRKLERRRGPRQGAYPSHYVDLTDNGKAMGIVPLDKLPVTREAYDTHAPYRSRYGPQNTRKTGYFCEAADPVPQFLPQFLIWPCTSVGPLGDQHAVPARPCAIR